MTKQANAGGACLAGMSVESLKPTKPSAENPIIAELNGSDLVQNDRSCK